MNPMPEYQPIEPLEPMNNNPSGKSRLMDMNLPERDGLQVSRRIRKQYAIRNKSAGPSGWHMNFKLVTPHG
jgi:CheY-like chemotaxis protein